jgi:anti-anti-sigma regulatory factor
MSPFAVSCEIKDGIPVFRISGYYEKEAGHALNAQAETHFQNGRIFLVLDVSACSVLSSPGVSTLVELAVNAADNYNGRLFLCGLDALKTNRLTLVGMQTMADLHPTEAAALAAARQHQITT